METIVDSILQWPVIVQGALGSCLFSLTLFLGQKAFAASSSKYLAFNRRLRLSSLQAEYIRYRAFVVDDKGYAAFLLVVLIYGSIHNLIKALICICIGFLLQSFIPVFGVVGFLFALYFLFKAANAVRDTEVNVDKETRLSELENEIGTLKKEISKTDLKKANESGPD